jgi:hypothetical protein
VPVNSPVSSRIALTNARREKATLLDFIGQAARSTSSPGTTRTLYILSCYFDSKALYSAVQSIRRELVAAGAVLSGVRVVVDAGDWIQNQLRAETLAEKIAQAARLPIKHVEFLPIRFPSQLLHAKAYAAISTRAPKTGFVVVTSGNLTRQGLGLIDGANRELAIVATEPESLASFETIVQGLTKHRITEEEAIRNDFYLRALALFGSGVFYHRWAGALGAEARFALTLTAKGKKRRKEDIAAFPGYQRDSESISRDPLGIEQILERKLAKPFPKAFWRLFSVDTVFGQWIPEPIARLVDKRLSQDVMPYVRAIASGTKAPRLTKISAELRRETHKYNRENLIMQDPSIVTVWRNRIERLRSNKELTFVF